MDQAKEKLTKLCLHRYKNKEGHMVIQLCPMDGRLDGNRLILTETQVQKFCQLVRKTKGKFYRDKGKMGVSDEDPELYLLVDKTMTKHIEAKVAEAELKDQVIMQLIEEEVDKIARENNLRAN